MSQYNLTSLLINTEVKNFIVYIETIRLIGIKVDNKTI